MPTDVLAQVSVLVGNTNCGTKGVIWVRTLFPEAPILYTADIHKCTKNALAGCMRIAQTATGSNVIIPESDAFSCNLLPHAFPPIAARAQRNRNDERRDTSNRNNRTESQSYVL